MQPKRGMGPFMQLGKRPGADPTTQAPPTVKNAQRPALIAFPRAGRRPMTDTASTPDTTRTATLPWRFRA